MSGTLNNLKIQIKKDIESFSDEKIINSDLEEWLVYLVDKYSIEPIELYLDDISQELSRTKVKKYNHFYQSGGYEPQFYSIDGYKITFSIPFVGDSDLLYMKPSTFYLTSFIVDNICVPKEDTVGVIKLSLEYPISEIKEKENLNIFIEEQFNSKFKNYIDMINNINEELNNFKISLEDIIRNSLNIRKEKVEDYILMGEKLNIPLRMNINAPNTTPIILKKRIKPKVDFPNQKKASEEYEISESDYTNIKNIINLACVSIEKTAKTFNKLNEEELRDIILSSLNSHYNGTASGEAFNKVGKTDIRIQFENKAAYIGECKIWYGEKELNEALEQLFSYTTWRDSKTSLIIFNKKNKDFNKLTDTIDNSLKSNKNCKDKIRISKNKWDCIFNKSEGNTEIRYVQILVYDLFC